MATAAAVEQEFHTRYYVRLNSAIVGAETDFDPALVVLVLQAQADTAIIYRFDEEKSEFQAIAGHSGERATIRDAGVTLTPAVSQWLFALTDARQGSAKADEYFERFPERLQYGVNQLLAIPLRNKESVLGLLTLGRRDQQEFSTDVLNIAQRTGRLLSAVLERDDLEQRLKERKVVERAKGILQQRRGLTEEAAYLLLRGVSRRRRLSMFEVATEIVDRPRPAQPSDRFQGERIPTRPRFGVSAY
jgi:GAF domain-containing protein